MNAARLREICLAMPGATESIQWRDQRVFKVGGKMFAISGYDADSLYSFKVDDDRFVELTGIPGIRPAPYLARARWVQVNEAECVLGDDELAFLVDRSWELVFLKLTKKLQQEICPTS